MMGSRIAGGDKATAWVKKAGKHAGEGSFDAAAQFGELLFICLNGEHALRALETIAPEHVAGKIVVDVTNPLDFTHGMPPRVLEEYSAVSLGERIQQTLEKIPEEYRLLLLLVADQELSYEEIGKLTEQSADAVRGKLHRARKVFAALFRKSA